jgi:hypothetical protein
MVVFHHLLMRVSAWIAREKRISCGFHDGAPRNGFFHRGERLIGLLASRNSPPETFPSLASFFSWLPLPIVVS